MDQNKPTLDEILAVYNSITPSRRRWIRLRNQLRNEWKELYAVMETASGRTNGKAVVFDPNWHEVADKGSVRGAVNRVPADTHFTMAGDATEAAQEEAAQVTEPVAIVVQDVSEAVTVPVQLDIVEEVAKVEAVKAPVKKKKKVAKKKK